VTPCAQYEILKSMIKLWSWKETELRQGPAKQSRGPDVGFQGKPLSWTGFKFIIEEKSFLAGKGRKRKVSGLQWD